MDGEMGPGGTPGFQTREKVLSLFGGFDFHPAASQEG
jgi:hypothetical protein